MPDTQDRVDVPSPTYLPPTAVWTRMQPGPRDLDPEVAEGANVRRVLAATPPVGANSSQRTEASGRPRVRILALQQRTRDRAHASGRDRRTAASQQRFRTLTLRSGPRLAAARWMRLQMQRQSEAQGQGRGQANADTGASDATAAPLRIRLSQRRPHRETRIGGATRGHTGSQA